MGQRGSRIHGVVATGSATAQQGAFSSVHTHALASSALVVMRMVEGHLAGDLLVMSWLRGDVMAASVMRVMANLRP